MRADGVCQGLQDKSQGVNILWQEIYVYYQCYIRNRISFPYNHPFLEEKDYTISIRVSVF